MYLAQANPTVSIFMSISRACLPKQLTYKYYWTSGGLIEPIEPIIWLITNTPSLPSTTLYRYTIILYIPPVSMQYLCHTLYIINGHHAVMLLLLIM